MSKTTETEPDNSARVSRRAVCAAALLAGVLVLAAVIHPLELRLGDTKFYFRAERIQETSLYPRGLHWTDLAGSGGRNTFVSVRVGERALVAGRAQKIPFERPFAGG
jgi:hypothetical protein